MLRQSIHVGVHKAQALLFALQANVAWAEVKIILHRHTRRRITPIQPRRDHVRVITLDGRNGAGHYALVQEDLMHEGLEALRQGRAVGDEAPVAVPLWHDGPSFAAPRRCHLAGDVLHRCAQSALFTASSWRLEPHFRRLCHQRLTLGLPVSLREGIKGPWGYGSARVSYTFCNGTSPLGA